MARTPTIICATTLAPSAVTSVGVLRACMRLTRTTEIPNVRAFSANATDAGPSRRSPAPTAGPTMTATLSTVP